MPRRIIGNKTAPIIDAGSIVAHLLLNRRLLPYFFPRFHLEDFPLDAFVGAAVMYTQMIYMMSVVERARNAIVSAIHRVRNELRFRRATSARTVVYKVSVQCEAEIVQPLTESMRCH